MATYRMHTDGAARGNPGPASVGVVIYDEEGHEVVVLSRPLGDQTNNQAEYRALIAGLQLLTRFAEAGLPAAQRVEARLDSELIVKQLAGQYKVKNAALKPLFEEAKALLAQFPQTDVAHVRRKDNARADELANMALDGYEAYSREHRDVLSALGVAV